MARAAVIGTAAQLNNWADRWRPHLPELPADPPRRLVQGATTRRDVTTPHQATFALSGPLWDTHGPPRVTV